jgi:hypothetical protein
MNGSQPHLVERAVAVGSDVIAVDRLLQVLQNDAQHARVWRVQVADLAQQLHPTQSAMSKSKNRCPRNAQASALQQSSQVCILTRQQTLAL